MEDLRQYLLSVTAAAAFCGILLTLIEKKSACAGIVRMLCGIFMAVTLLRPAVQLRVRDLEVYIDDIRSQSESAAAVGAAAAEEAMAAIIKSRTEAYILDKAESMGLSLRVEVVLTEDAIPQPGSVRIQGTVPPYARAQLRAWIRDTVGIGEEDQLWI